MRYKNIIGLSAILMAGCNTNTKNHIEQKIVPFTDAFYHQFKDSSTRTIPGKTYQVKKGDTITSILQKEAAKNPCFRFQKSSDSIDILFSSSPNITYEIKFQETLDSANKQYVRTLNQRHFLRKDNYNTKWARIQRGDKIIIPDFNLRDKNPIGTFTFFGGEYKSIATKYATSSYTKPERTTSFDKHNRLK